jgi:hypothetical protein
VPRLDLNEARVFVVSLVAHGRPVVSPSPVGSMKRSAPTEIR